MNIHEYQAREIFEKYGIPVTKGKVCYTPADAYLVAKEIGKQVVIKAQVLVGGRGKAGGIKLANTPDEAKEKAKEILGMNIKGCIVNKVLVAAAVDIKEELYMGIVHDRVSKKIVAMTSPAGGIDIEEVARIMPEKIYKSYIDPLVGIRDYQLRSLVTPLFTDNELIKEGMSILSKLYKLFLENDCSLAEINPLVISSDNKLFACDTKINIDDNGLIRHEDFNKFRDKDAENSLEYEAREFGLSYVGLDGNVACIVNGAGLAMTTMDLIKLHGGEPANFLDVGGSSSPEKVINAMKIILKNKNVKSILFNIFGGITRCDDIANGIIQALNTMEIPHPIVVRLFGTNMDKAKEILSKTNLIFAETMEEGVKKAIELAKR